MEKWKVPPVPSRVARTIADLDGQAEILAEHVNEAVNYRLLDRQFWS